MEYSKEEIERLKQLEKKQKLRNKKQNEAIKEKYDRLGAAFPKGTKERILNRGFKINNFLIDAVINELDRLDTIEYIEK